MLIQIHAARRHPTIAGLVSEPDFDMPTCVSNLETPAYRKWAERHDLPQRVLFALPLDKGMRRWAIRFQHHKAFKVSVHLVVVINFCILASAPVGWGHADPNTDPAGGLLAKHVFFDIVTAVLVLEFLLHVMEYGLLMTPVAVLRTPKRCLELAIIIAAFSDGGYAGRHVLGGCAKCLRILWVLEWVSSLHSARGYYFSSLRHILKGITNAAHPVLWVVSLLVLATSLFAIVGMRLVGGTFGGCSDVVTLLYPAGSLECVSTHLTSSGVLFPRAWHDAPMSFNDLSDSMLTLSVVATLRWSHTSHALMDASFPAAQAIRLYRPEMAVFLASFIVAVSLFLGSLSSAYVATAIRDSESIHSKRTRRYIMFKNRILEWTPKPPTEKATWKGAEFARIVLDTPGCKTLLEFSNAAAIAMLLVEQTSTQTEASPGLVQMLDLQRFILTVVLFIEVMLYCQAYGFLWAKNQARLWMNIVSILAAIILTAGKASRGPYQRDRWLPTPEFRLLVLVCEKARYARLVLSLYEYAHLTHWVQMRVIFSTISFSARRLASYVFLTSVFLLLFAVVGMQLFSNVRPGQKLGNPTSLSTFPDALLTTFYLVAGEDWQQLLIDCSVSYPDCTRPFYNPAESVGDMGGADDCGSPPLAWVYFLCLKGVFSSLLFGALMWVLIESLQEARDVEEGRIQNVDLARLGEAWNQDHSIVGHFVLVSHVGNILRKLPLPLCLVPPEQLEKSSRPYHQQSVVLRLLIELSILAWCRKNQRSEQPTVPNCADTAYPDIRSISIMQIKSEKKVSWFDLGLTLMHTVTPEVQSEQVLILRRPVLIIVEKVLAAIRISIWLRNIIKFRDGWGKLLDKVHDAVLHMREQEALERERLRKEKEAAEAEDKRRRKRMSEEIYNIEAWVMKTCPSWEELEHDRLVKQAELEVLAAEKEAEDKDRVLAAERGLVVAADCLYREEEVKKQYLRQVGTRSKYLMKFQKSAIAVQSIARLSRQDGHSESYFARAVSYQVMIPYGTQSGNPIFPSTSEHLPGHPFWKDSDSSFRSIAVPISPYEHPAAQRPDTRDASDGKVGGKKKTVKGRSRFGYGAYSAKELCAVMNALIQEDLMYYIRANKRVHYTHGLTEEVWDHVCSSLIQFCPPAEDHHFPGGEK